MGRKRCEPYENHSVRYEILNTQTTDSVIELPLWKFSSNTNKHDALAHHTKQTMRWWYIASPNTPHSPHADIWYYNMRLRRLWANVLIHYESLAQMSMFPRTLYVASSDLSGPLYSYALLAQICIMHKNKYFKSIRKNLKLL